MEKSNTPLFVDLDGTLFKTDLMYECAVILVRKNPFFLLKFLFWAIKGGKLLLKNKIAQHAVQLLNFEDIPINQNFFNFLQLEYKNGRKIILATGNSKLIASAVCRFFPFFSTYLSSDSNKNLKGNVKLDAIRKLFSNFSYAGNSKDDLCIFQSATESILVNPTLRTLKKLSSYEKLIDKKFDINTPTLKNFLKLLRLHQWLKNSLIFLPLLTSGKYLCMESWYKALLAFLLFSFMASSTYILNDLFDLESDRRHPQKKDRPIASGIISIPLATFISLLLFATALMVSSFINRAFTIILFLYFVTTIFYTLKIKQYVILDTITLALLYVVRVFAGASAINVMVSFWLLTFCVFIFLSLALLKRCAEIKLLKKSNKKMLKGRDYKISDYPILTSFGSSSAMIAILFLCFYLNSNAMVQQYQKPTLMWLIVPLLIYWIMRMWIKTHRGEMYSDPIVFTMRDKGSIIIILITIIITIISRLL